MRYQILKCNVFVQLEIILATECRKTCSNTVPPSHKAVSLLSRPSVIYLRMTFEDHLFHVYFQIRKQKWNLKLLKSQKMHRIFFWKKLAIIFLQIDNSNHFCDPKSWPESLFSTFKNTFWNTKTNSTFFFLIFSFFFGKKINEFLAYPLRNAKKNTSFP